MKILLLLLFVSTHPQGRPVPPGGFSEDMWANFHPETVTKFGCTVGEAVLVAPGSSTDQWRAHAHAERNEQLGPWEFTLGMYPADDKGFRKAMHDCEEWQIEAHKRVQASLIQKQKAIMQEQKKAK
jgi:hypothetical protein